MRDVRLKTEIIVMIFSLLQVACQDTKTKNQAAIEERVIMYMTSPENSPGVFNYTPLSFSELSSYESKSTTDNSDTCFVVEHEYKGYNVANREVKRKAEIYFDRNYEVIGYRDTFYYNPLNKDSLKSEYRKEN